MHSASLRDRAATYPAAPPPGNCLRTNLGDNAIRGGQFAVCAFGCDDKVDKHDAVFFLTMPMSKMIPITDKSMSIPRADARRRQGRENRQQMNEGFIEDSENDVDND
jgi:hypothetical protein